MLVAQGVGEIIEKSLQALGGTEELRSLESRLLVGEALLGGGIVSGEFRWLTQRPNHHKIDKHSYLPVKTLSTTFNPQTGEDVAVESHSGNYKEVNGHQIPHHLETFAGGQVINEFKVTKAEINIKASLKEFRPPSN